MSCEVDTDMALVTYYGLSLFCHAVASGEKLTALKLQ